MTNKHGTYDKKNKSVDISREKLLIISVLFFIGFSLLLLSKQIENETCSLIVELLGSFLVIAIPVEIIREVFFEEVNRASFTQEVSQLFDDKIDAKLIQAREFGLGRIDDSLNVKAMFDKLEPDDTLWWLDTFCPGHNQWIEHVKKAVQRGASINMLILDSKSTFCEMRAKEIEESYTKGSFNSELNLFIEDFKQCKESLKQKKYPGSLKIFLYDDLLGVPCYIVTKNNKAIYAYSSMYLTEPTGVKFPHFYWREGLMCNYLYNYVVKKSEKSTEIE